MTKVSFTLGFDYYTDLAEKAFIAERFWRRGQAYFNILAKYRPDISERIRASEIDPFHDDGRLDAFLEFTREHW